MHRTLSVSIAALALFTVLAPSRLRAEEKKSGSFYKSPRSYATTRDPDPPKYVHRASETALASFSGGKAGESLKWLEIGLDHRTRFEYRENDFRAKRPGTDTPILHRTRLYLGIKEVLDPFRLAVEVQDSRRSRGWADRPVPESDEVNEFQVIRLYGELFSDHILPEDALGNERPLSLRYGIHNFEFLDRRLIGNNQWRNTANTFQGFHAAIGQDSNDWQLDLLALQPLNRLKHDWDRPVDPKYLYGLIGHWRGWSKWITLEPFYLQFQQSRFIGSDGKANTERQIHVPGLRAYGFLGKSGFDFDLNIIPQFGKKAAIRESDLGPGNNKNKDTRAEETIRAFGATAEVGYTWESHAWKPRLSAFYGYASGDRNANPELDGSKPNAPAWDTTDNRFERLYGFQRPWSANDYIVFENISAPKLRLEARPAANLRVDLGYSGYWLASGTDRFYRANAGAGTSRDYYQNGGKFLGHEFDARARYNWGKQTEVILGYAHFESGKYLQTNVRGGASDFVYLELNYQFF
jgi:hypothetical protein